MEGICAIMCEFVYVICIWKNVIDNDFTHQDRALLSIGLVLISCSLSMKNPTHLRLENKLMENW